MKIQFWQRRLAWFALVFALAFVLIGMERGKSGAVPGQPGPGKRLSAVAASPAADAKETSYVCDTSSENDRLVVRILPTNSKGKSSMSDLWLHTHDGTERLLTKDVVSARFSPDGGKVAYATGDYELFIETLGGKRLAQIPRASEPIWRADSSTVSFLAMPSLDYPDLQQVTIYNLDSDSVTEPEHAN